MVSIHFIPGYDINALIVSKYIENLYKGEIVMYESYTRQALPSKEYRELIGSSICVFNSNNSFIIENLIRFGSDLSNSDWYDLVDKVSGKLVPIIEENIKDDLGKEIAIKFKEIVEKRNRIVHSFQITDKDGKQRLATKEKTDFQFIVDEEYLLKFIKDNEELSSLLHRLRGF